VKASWIELEMGHASDGHHRDASLYVKGKNQKRQNVRHGKEDWASILNIVGGARAERKGIITKKDSLQAGRERSTILLMIEWDN